MTADNPSGRKANLRGKYGGKAAKTQVYVCKLPQCGLLETSCKKNTMIHKQTERNAFFNSICPYKNKSYLRDISTFQN